MSRLTVHGVPMSPRMERLWNFIQQDRSIPLTDWSTDQGVESYLGPLQSALAEAQRRAAAAPSDEQAAALVRDVECLLRRRPQSRVSDGAVRAQQQRAATSTATVEDVAAPIAHASHSHDEGWGSGSGGGW